MRDVAGDAGVHAALIYRYFESKQGLFEACLDGIVEDAVPATTRGGTDEQVVAEIMQEVLASSQSERSQQLLLLLSASEEQTASTLERILGRLATRMAATTSSAAVEKVDTQDLLRAQVALAAVIGVIAFRAGGVLQPLASSSSAALEPLLRPLFTSILVTREKLQTADSIAADEPD